VPERVTTVLVDTTFVVTSAFLAEVWAAILIEVGPLVPAVFRLRATVAPLGPANPDRTTAREKECPPTIEETLGVNLARTDFFTVISAVLEAPPFWA